MLSYDLYSETNPVFISFLLYRFFEAFNSDALASPHFSLCYLVVPISLSDRLQPSFSSTNSSTGLLAWASRFPEVRIGLGREVVASRQMTTDGLRTCLHCGLITIGARGVLLKGAAKTPPANVRDKLPDNPKQVIRRAERLGKWMSTAGSPSSIFSALEVNL
jgi:hypothetical protein